jgi:hypothetical protein
MQNSRDLSTLCFAGNATQLDVMFICPMSLGVPSAVITSAPHGSFMHVSSIYMRSLCKVQLKITRRTIYIKENHQFL